MCFAMDATTMGEVATGLQVGGAISGAYGAYQKSKQDQAAYEYQAAVDRNNAQLATWQAEDAVTRGQVAEASQRLKTAQLAGTQRASLAARGVDVNEGSPLNILMDTTYMGELDALTIRDNALREAYGYKVQSNNASSNAAILSARAGMENPAGSAISSLLTSGGVVADSWYRRKLATTPDTSGGRKT